MITVPHDSSKLAPSLEMMKGIKLIESFTDAELERLISLGTLSKQEAHTNVIIENGTGAQQQIPHLSLGIIPRVEGDGLNFQWQPKKLSDEQMGLAELQLKELTKNFGIEPEKKEPIKLDDEKAKGEAVKKSSYMTRQLRRLP